MIPLAIADQHLAIIGKTGSGKTYVAKGLVERLMAEDRKVCVVDPTGVWWGMKAAAGGAPSGLGVVVAGGAHADVPLPSSPDAGRALADLVIETRHRFVVDLSEFLEGERTRFCEAFFAELYRRCRQALHLVLDEADELAPQSALPEQRRLFGQVDRIVRRGRAKGFRAVMITQRPAALHKNVLSQSNALILLRLTAPQDRKAVEDWIRTNADPAAGREAIDGLRRLEVGEGWVWAPELDVFERLSFPAIAMLDTSRAPEHGEHLVAPPAAEVEGLDAIAATLANAGAPAEVGDGHDDARASVVRAGNPPRAAYEALIQERDLLRDELDAAHDRLVAAEEVIQLFVANSHAATARADELHRTWQSGTKVVHERTKPERETGTTPIHPVANNNEMVAARPNGPDVGARAKGHPPRGKAAMIEALGNAWPEGYTRRQLALLAGMRHRGGGFGNYLSELRRDALVVDQVERIVATFVLLTKYPPSGGPASRAERIEMWARAVGPARKCLKRLAQIYPDALSRAELAACVGMVRELMGNGDG